MSDESSVELNLDHHIVAVKEMQYKGLRLVGYNRGRIKRAADPTNIERFLSHFGVSPAENIRMMSASWVGIIGTHSTSRICITSVSLFWNVRLYSYPDINV